MNAPSEQAAFPHWPLPEGLSFLQKHAGITAYAKVQWDNEGPDWLTLRDQLTGVLKSGPGFVVGTVSGSAREGRPRPEDDPHILLQEEGWIATYFPANQPTARMFCRDTNDRVYARGSSYPLGCKYKSSDALIPALDLIQEASGAGVLETGFYHFAYPDATMLIGATRKDDKPLSLFVPSEVELLSISMSFSWKDAVAVILVDGIEVGRLVRGNSSSATELLVLPTFLFEPDVYHTIDVNFIERRDDFRFNDGYTVVVVAREGESRSASLKRPAGGSFDAASVLARFSTEDPRTGEERAVASREIIAQYESGKPDPQRVFELLHTIAPELSVDDRRRAADELGRLSEDDEWDGEEVGAIVSHLAALVTGKEVNAAERIAAADEMVKLYWAGDLHTGRALSLMDAIAPGLSLLERTKAAELLAKISAADNWDHAESTEAANEVFRLDTGVPLQAERRLGAAVDLAAMGVKVFDREGHFDDRDIAVATELIKQSLTGELTVESVESLLGLDRD